MNQDQVIAAAREARIGVMTERLGFVVFNDVSSKHLERFYAIAYRAGLEDAAKVATQINLVSQGVLPIRVALISSRIAKSILALKEQDAAIAAGKGEA